MHVTQVGTAHTRTPKLQLTLQQGFELWTFKLSRPIEKIPSTSGPVQFKPTLFNGQLYFQN